MPDKPNPPAGKKPAALPVARPASLPKPAAAADARKPALPPGKLPPGAARPKEKSGVERIKEASRALRGDLPEQLAAPVDHFDEAGKQLVKFPGMY